MTTATSNAAASSTAAWERFLRSSGVPPKMRAKYAESFIKQRIAPHLLRDMGKDDLRDLGINALGDQLAILSYVRQCDGNPPDFRVASVPVVVKQTSQLQQKSRQQIVDEEEDEDRNTYDSDEGDEQMAMDEEAARSKAPDRDDIYHIKMPDGKLPRTRNILEMHSALKEQGIIKRGVSGVRRSGIELRRLAAQSKTIQKTSVSMSSPRNAGRTAALVDTDVTSSTAGFVPLGTLRSDMISTKTMVVKDTGSGQQKQMRNNNRPSIVKRMGGSASAIPVQVRFDTLPPPMARPRNVQQRKLVAYDDTFLIGSGQEAVMYMEQEEEPMMTGQRGRQPISERLQLLGGGGGGGMGKRASRIAGPMMGANARKRPTVTVSGRMISLGGGRGGSGQRVTKRGGGGGGRSILDRITLA